MGNHGALHFTELDTWSLQYIFSFLSANHLVLAVKPLSKEFRQYVKHTLQERADKVAASIDLPSWALPTVRSGHVTLQATKAVD